MAKFITFNGTTLIHPGGLTKVDTTGMAQVGAGVSGVVGVIGEADYGEPYDPVTAAAAGTPPKVYEFTDPNAMADTFKSGELADAVEFLFNPSNDIRIPGGTQRVIAIKSNRDTQSSAVAQNIVADAVSCILTSKSYGLDSNSMSMTTSVNTLDGNTVDVSITDGNTGVTETFTQVAGEALLDVQYAPSTPTTAVASLVTNVNSVDATQLPVVAVPPGCVAGRWVQITGHDGTQAHLVGQVRRINNIAGVVLHLQSSLINDDGTTSALINDGTTFKVIREAVGPFFVSAYNSATSVITVEGAQDNNPPGYTDGSPLFWVNVTGAAQIASVTSGPNYINIVSGTGAGQIRRISAAVPGASGQSTLTIVNGFDTDPDNTSQFMFINAVCDILSPTFTGGNATGEGAIGVVAGSSGLATTLTLRVRPGFGEPATHGGAAIAAGGAGSGGAGLRPADWTWTLSSTLNANALVNAINLGNVISGAAKGADTTVGAWKARVGPGRDGLLVTSRLDFSGRANGAYSLTATSSGVDCLCDFNTTNLDGEGTYNSAPNRYHRFVDNVAQLVDTINAQSALITATRATIAGGAPYAGVNFGDGIPAFSTYALGSAAYNPTTASNLADCFDELIKYRHNTAVALWSTAQTDAVGATLFTIDYVHSLLATHADNGAGAYKNEVDCIAAFQPTTTDTINIITTKATTLNNRNVALVFQDIKRTGLTGSMTQFAPHMLGCAVAGMEAGSEVGTPLTFKLVRASDILCANTTIDTLDKNTSDELLLNGCLFTEKVKGQGFRIVRNLSTYVATDNLAYTDRHINYELNYMAYDLRTFIEEKFVGVKATPATVAAIKSGVVTKLEFYKTSLEIIVNSQDPDTGALLNAYRNLRVTISGDICTIRFEIFPAVGINYITFEIFAQLPTISA